MSKSINSRMTPARVLVLGFTAVILVGGLLLTLPLATRDGLGLSLLDALFTSTSAVCVTGLVVVDTLTTFTLFGQLTLLMLIQVGGLGFMTFATFFAILLGRKITLRERLLLQEALNQNSLAGIVRLAKHVVLYAFAIEALGALILALNWVKPLGWGRAIYYGIFHSVSAFNNAGFDLFGHFSSLTGFVGDWVTNLTIMGLITTGGFGFAVLAEILATRGRTLPHWRSLSLHTRMVIGTSAGLVLAGTLLIYVLEFGNPKTLGGLNSGSQVLAALFQAVTPRTAGFNTLNLADFHLATVMVILILMFIGASPGSTGGGIKTTTFLTLVLALRSILKGENQVKVRERALPQDTIAKAAAIAALGGLFVFLLTFLLSLSEKTDLLTALFETTSAFGTVGLTLGLTPQLSALGRVAIMFGMFVGRVGPLTLGFALTQKWKASGIKYPEEKILVG
ncbi:MAG: TrkH family potassium uptake protein [Desulfitobacteriaceae bacterium]|nr:TrkH family potassium uptake protein [Desulfitobacteriaceae bacterium]MDI6880855.1 TrkH family potassium uptake protein [Desulfitobacteriaceae bacterium]MDI6913383.1 TrkH family potassium uptake protein [Desulfitobacteriaceae bacterium]